MFVKKTSASALSFGVLALTLASAVPAASYRLAYSKAENLEVFVDYPDSQTAWCANPLALRMVSGATPDNAAVGRLLPKLGGLLQSQCAAVTNLTWRSVDVGGREVATGTATKSDAWTSHVLAGEANPSVAAAPAPAANSNATTPEANPSAPTPTANPSAPETAPAPSPAIAANPAPVPAAVNNDLTPALTPTVPASPPVPAPAASASLPQINAPKPVFAVAGWTPPSEADALKSADFIFEIQDQNGCRYRTNFKPAGTEAAYLKAISTGLICGADGYATGTGKLSIMRADGMQLQNYAGSFYHGMPFNGAAAELPVVAFDENHAVYLLLSSDPTSQVLYLLRVALGYDGMWNMNGTVIVAVAGNPELFRQADSIRNTILTATNALSVAAPKVQHAEFYAVRDFPKGMLENDRSQWLYEVYLGRNSSQGNWNFNPQNAQNYLFLNDAKIAEQQRMAAQQQQFQERNQHMAAAQVARQQLITFAQLQSQANNPKQLLAQFNRDVTYAPGSGGGYSRLVAGGSADYSHIVHINGKSGDRWKIDFPYEAQLEANAALPKINEGWFLLKGQVHLDAQQVDSDKMPLTLITSSYLQPCKEDGCHDLRDPLQVMRLQLSDPNWTPEAAKASVEKAGLTSNTGLGIY